MPKWKFKLLKNVIIVILQQYVWLLFIIFCVKYVIAFYGNLNARMPMIDEK